MKAIAFNGSPRKGGNTELLLNTVLENIAAEGIETEFVQIGGKKIRGCTGCFACAQSKDNRCVFDDDILNDCIVKMLEADAIIIGSPTYFANVSTETKALLDRAGFVSRVNGDIFKRKIGAGVIAVRRGGAVPALDAINHMFMISQMIIPCSTYWNFGIGLNKGESGEDEEGMANMKNLGENIAWLMKKLNS